MKKLLFLPILSIVLFTSCSEPSPEEQMLKVYLDKELMKTINVKIDDTDYKVNSIEKSGVVTGKDSVTYYYAKLKDLWPSESLSKPEPFRMVLIELDTIIKQYDALIKLYSEMGDEYSVKKNQRKRKEYRDIQTNVMFMSLSNAIYSKKGDSILSHKYKVNYSITNPVLKARQTFNKTFYSNANNTEFVNAEDL